jgi:cell division protein FtsI/penicillin-binding protein 2
VNRIAGGARINPEHHRVLPRKIARKMAHLLVGVVDTEGGTGSLAAVPGYHVAGKTGTAQKPIPGGYSTSKYVASFVGFVPATRPRPAILVMVDEPQDAIWGGVVAAPAFQSIAQFALQYLEVPPDAPFPAP